MLKAKLILTKARVFEKEDQWATVYCRPLGVLPRHFRVDIGVIIDVIKAETE